MTSISFKDYAELTSVQRYELHKRSVTVDCIAVPRKSGRAALARALDAPQPVGQDGLKIVRRKAVFRDHDLAALFEWAADQLVIATPNAIIHALDYGFVWSHGDEVPIYAVLPVNLQSAYERWQALLDVGDEAVRQWHDALEPGEMVFLPPEPWREERKVRS